MLLPVLIICAVIIVAILLVKLIDKFLPAKARPIVSILLWVVTGIFGYLIYGSVMAPIRFDEEKQQRYELAVNKILDIKNAQMAHKSVKGSYAKSFEELVKFIETEKFEIIERKDIMVPDSKKNAAFGLKDGVGGYFKPEIVTKTIGFVSVKDSLFKNTDRYKFMNKVKVADFEVPVSMKDSTISVKDKLYPTLEVIVDKNDILKGMDEELLKQEKNKKSIEEIDGDKIVLGSLFDVTLTGNWPKKYGKND